MAASIDFTDTIGAASLTNGKSNGADRFGSWVPWQTPIGPTAEALANGIRYAWVHRTDYGARFELRHIPNDRLDIVLRLLSHLAIGGTCTVNTGDSSARSYATCGIAPGWRIENACDFGDPRVIEYTLALNLLNHAGTQMICIY